jgi:PAS domain S-box-containing protein
MGPPTARNEAERLAALKRHYILDTPPEAALDRITALAARLFSVPISLIVFVDEARQWFKSAYGLDIRETPRELALCAHTILSDDVMVVPDAAKDARFRNSPLVVGPPGMRFYAGAPLKTPDGRNIGTLCVIDTAPREALSDEQEQLLSSLADLVMDQLELRLATINATRHHAEQEAMSEQLADMSGRLKMNERIITHVLEGLPVGVWVADAAGKRVCENAAGRAIWGGEHIGIDDYGEYSGWWPETGKRLTSEEWGMARAIRRGETSINEVIDIEAFDGKRKTISQSAAPLRDPSGEILGGVAVIEDITERRLAEEQHRRADEMLHRVADELNGLINASPLAIISFDRDGTVRSWSSAAEQMFGWTAAEVIGKRYPLIPRGAEPEFKTNFEHLVHGGVLRNVQAVRQRKDGSEIEVTLSAAALHGGTDEITGVVTVLADNTAAKAAERELRESEERYRNLVESSPTAIAVHSDRKLVYVNPTTVRLFGASRAEDLLGRDPAALVHPDYLQRYHERTLEVERGEAVPMAEAKLVRLDGSVIHAEVISISHMYQGRPAVQVAMRDITEARAMEAALQESEERFRRAILDAPMPIMIHAEDGRVLQLNRAWSDVTGYTAEELPTTNDWVAKLFPDAEPDIRDYIQGLYQLEAPRQGSEFSIRTKSGAMRIWSFSTAPLGPPTKYGRAVITMAMDITERQSLEHQLAQAQKMEAIGLLAGGVAHDFNNLLTVISGYANLLMESLSEFDPATQQVKEIAGAAERAAALTRQLLAFSRKQVLQPANVDINSAVRDSERMLRRLIGEDIEIGIALANEEMRAMVDPGQLAQIIMNLAVNARDAMPEGGTLSIQTEGAELGKEFTAGHPTIAPGPYVRLSISDTGAGMDAATLARIFDPFFTTKASGAGTGLGLSTVYGIIKQSNGHISVESEPGHGTAFQIYFPRIFEAARVVETAAPVSCRGTETVLVVEDELALRKLARDILCHAGYKVVEAANGGEALLACERHPAEIALMITDLIMPGMSGRELADRLAPLRPGMKVLFMSGYTSHAVLNTGVLESGVQFIQKPFTPSMLTDKVRQILRAGS